MQIQNLDLSQHMPANYYSLKKDEDRFMKISKMVSLDLSYIQVPLTPKHSYSMLSKDQSFQCTLYDLWDTLQDLLDDGEHAEYAVFNYTPEYRGSARVISELWSADWWKDEQAKLPPYSSILAVIFYVDETNVTFQGRNVHPIYVTLGNLHVEYRFVYNQSFLIPSLTDI